MNGAVIQAFASHWRAHPLQLAMLLVGLMLATALWSGVQAINAEARAAYARAAAQLGQDRLERLVPEAGVQIGNAVFRDLREAGWQVSPVVEGRLRVEGSWLRLLGVDPPSLPEQAGFAALPGGGASMMLALAPPEILFAAPETLERLTPAAAEPFGVELRAAEGLAPGTLVAEIRIARRLLDAQGEISYFLVAPQQDEARTPLAEAAPGLRLVAPDGEGDLGRLTDSFHLNLTAFGFLSFVVGLFIVNSAVGLAFEQRRPVLRTLRALGVPLRRIVALMLAEMVGLALLAGLAGVALGYLIALTLLPDVAATLSGLYGATIPGTLALRPEWWLGGLAIATLGALAASAQAIWRIMRLPLLAPAQPRAWARASERALAVQGVAALALMFVAAALMHWGSGLAAGFGLLAALLLGAALVLPVLLAGVLALAMRWVRGPVAEWFLADTRQQLPGLSLALMALLLALAANIGVGTMVSSFRLTFTGWLDQRLAAELYVTARDEAEASDLRRWLGGRADAVLPVWHVEADLAGLPGRIYAVADHETYRAHWPLLAAVPGVWDQVAGGAGLLVNEQLARAVPLAPGDRLALPRGPVMEVAGIYSDYGNPQPQVMIGLPLFEELFPRAPRLHHAVRVAPEAVAGLADEIADRFGLPPQNVVDQGAAKATSLAIFERTFTVTGALNVLTFGVAAIALLATLLTLSGMRLPQLAPVWAIGMTRRRLAALEFLRTLLLAALTFVAALPAGLALAWVLLAVVNVEAFGWRLPMYRFPGDWLRLGGLALVAAGAAAALPVRRLATIPPMSLLRVFAAER